MANSKTILREFSRRLREEHGLSGTFMDPIRKEIDKMLDDGIAPEIIELTGLYIIDNNPENFNNYLFASNFNTMQQRLKDSIPPGAWSRWLWYYKLPEGPIKFSARYWLDAWSDCLNVQVQDYDTINQAEQALIKLETLYG